MNFVFLLSLCWFPFFIGIIFLVHKTSRSLTSINIYTYFFYSFFIYHGIFIPFCHQVNLEAIGLELTPSVIIRWYLSLMLMYCFIIGTIGIRNRYFKHKHKSDNFLIKCKAKLENFEVTNHVVNFKSMTFGVRSFILMLVIASFVFFVLWNPRLIIESLTTQLTAEEFRNQRIMYGSDYSSFDGNVAVRLANSLKPSLLPMILYVFYFARTKNVKYKVGFWVVFIINFLLNLITGAKHGVVSVIIGLFFCKRIEDNKIQLTGKNLSIILSFVLVLFLVVFPFQYSIQYPSQTYNELVYTTFYRITAETSRVLQVNFYLYPDIFPHLLGMSSSIISQIFGSGEILDPGRIARSYLEYGNTYDDTGTWNAAFIGAAWADFGYAGVILESIFVSFLLYSYERWFLTIEKTPLSAGTYVSLIMSASNLSQVNLFTTLLTFGLLSNFLFYIFLRKIDST